MIQGDFNLNSDLWDNSNYSEKSLSDIWRSKFAQNGLTQTDMGITYMSFYTLQNGEKAKSALDHVYSNDEKVFTCSKEQKLPNSLSDHLAIYSEFQMSQGKHENKRPNYFLRRCWKKFNQNDFMKDLTNQPWETVIDPKKTVHEQSQTFDQIFKETLDRHAPIRKTKIHDNFRDGLSETTKKLMRERFNQS